MPRASNGTDFVEIYNEGTTARNIGGWTITGRRGDGSWGTLYTFPAGYILQPGQYFVVWLPGNGLHNSQGTITLRDSSGSTVDSVGYAQLGNKEGVARGYIGNGIYSNTWTKEDESQSTPGQPTVPEFSLRTAGSLAAVSMVLTIVIFRQRIRNRKKSPGQ